MQNNNIAVLANLHPEMAKKIIKDFKLPFNYCNQQQFIKMVSNMVEVAPEYNDAVDAMVNVCLRIDAYEQPNFCGVIRTIMDAMVNHILNSNGYEAFNQSDINTFFPLQKSDIPTGDNYNYENAGKMFISIDLKNAAFQAMKTWDRLYGNQRGYLIGINTETYSDFVWDVIVENGYDKNYGIPLAKAAYEYIRNCKSLRQVIFGKTNPKRIMHIEKFIMQTVCHLVKMSFNLEPVRFNNDEVIYEYNEELEKSLFVEDTLSKLEYSLGDTKIDVPMDFHKNLYTLREYSIIQHDDMIPVENKKPIKFYIKDNMAMVSHTKLPVDFKSLPSNVYLIARALLSGRPDLAHFFETQPILVDGVFHWLAILTCPCHPEGDDVDINTWELRSNPHNNE